MRHLPLRARDTAAPADAWRDPAVWLAVLLALAVRLLYNWALHPDGRGVSQFVIDEREYYSAAHILAEGRGFSFFDTALWLRPPLYVLFLAGLPGVSAPVAAAQAILSALTLLPLATLASRIGGTPAARWAAILGAIYLPFTLFAGLWLSETLFLLLFALLVVALLRANDSLALEGKAGFVWAGASGFLLGLSVLTRATALGFVPLAAVWLVIASRGRASRQRRSVFAGLLVLFVCLVTLLPWTLRNYAAYHRIVAVDTTSGYNLWLGSVGVRDEPRLQADLMALPNPVERQDFAYARAFSQIRNDPAFFMRKGLKESADLWAPLFQAEERGVNGFALGRVPGWHLASLFVFDDLLYAAILLLSILGLLGAGAGGLRLLTFLWVLLWVATAFVFFAVTRFRLPVVAMLIPWAGAGVTQLRSLPVLARGVSYFSRAAALAGALLVLLLVLPGIVSALPEYALGIERWGAQASYRSGEKLLIGCHPAEAAAEYRRADTTLADTRYGLAAALLQSGKPEQALALLTDHEPADRYEPYILRGEAARMSGDLQTAKTFFNVRVVKLAGDDALQWAWDHLAPLTVSRIDLGSGLDVGYIRGFYAPETDASGMTFRWTGEHPQVRGFPLQKGGATIEWSGWRPSSAAPARITLAESGSELSLVSETGWVTQDASLTRSGGCTPSFGVRITVNGFVASGSDPRLLGVRISQVVAK